MTDAILVINAGSSSIKFATFAVAPGEPRLLVKGQLDGLGTDPAFRVKDASGSVIDDRDEWPRGSPLDHAGAMRFILGWVRTHADRVNLVAAGHRIVHGGLAFDRPVRIGDDVLRTLQALIPLAPLHQPHNLAAVRAIRAADPTLPQVACFDTAFHRTQPKVAQAFAIPRALSEQGVRRYGFHGLSYEYIARRLPDHAPGARRVVVAHLGSGASMCAIEAGRSIESTMGFTAVDGLPMGTRTGALDPGVILYLMQHHGYDASRIERFLYKESGLLGVSGISNDMRDLLDSGEAAAQEAIALFVYQIGRHLGALAAVLGGLDALVFTAGIGENAPPIREAVCRGAGWLGVHLDAAANQRHGPRISSDDSPVSAWVIPTNEELMIALHTEAVLAGA